MKRIGKTVVTISMILALSLGIGGIAMGAGNPPPTNALEVASILSNTQAGVSQNRFANGTIALAGVSPGGLQAAVNAVLISHAGQSASNFNYSVITKLALMNMSSLNAADQSFIAGYLSNLTSLDLSGHVPSFSIDFQNLRTLTEVTLPVDVILADTMFNGNDRLARILFLGLNAPVISADAFSGVSAIAYVPNQSRGGFENPEFTDRFTSVLTTISPAFTTQPQSQTLSPGQDAVFSVAIAGTPAPALQWQVSTNGGQTWTNIDGQTGTTLRLNNVTVDNSGNQYRCIATSIAAEVVSNVATLTVNSAPVITHAKIPNITGHPANTSAIVNGNITLSVSAEVTDGGTLSYQWFSNTTSRNTGGTMIAGATSRTFDPPVTNTGTVYYYVVVTNTNNNVNGTRTAVVTSSTARVIVDPLINAQTPNIIDQPESLEVILDGHAILIVNARSADNGTLRYQWFRNESNSNTGGTMIEGATGATLMAPTDTLGVTYYYVVVTNTNSNVNGSEAAAITSDVISVNVITTPDAPQGLSTVVSENQVTLRWEAPEFNGGSEIIRYQVSDDVVTFWIEANGEYEHTFYGLKDDAEYIFKVRAVNAAGAGAEASLTESTPEQDIIHVSEVTLNRDALYLIVGEYETLTATLSPVDATITSVRWSSSDNSVATVDRSGMVTAVSTGSAIITVTTLDGSHTASSTVTVMGTGGGNLIWIGLGVLAPLGTGTGLYIWKRKKR